MSKWIKGMLAAILIVGFMVGCSQTTNSPVNGDGTAPTSVENPADGTGASGAAGTGAADSDSADQPAGDAGATSSDGTTTK